MPAREPCQGDPQRVGLCRGLADDLLQKLRSVVSQSEGTVKNHVRKILEKLGTRDRTRAVLKAITLRII